jgi:septal ring factor EnvC (AmiA/AmiB activator)
LLIGLAAAAPAPNQQQLREAERARAASQAQQRAAQAKAATSAAEEHRLAAGRVAAAAALRTLEAQSADAADRVAELSKSRGEAEVALAARARAMGPLLPVIQRLALYPAETLLAVPMPPEQAIRGIVVLGGLTRRLEADAAALRLEQEQLNHLSAQVEQASADLAVRQRLQAQQAASLDAQLDAARIERKAAEGEAADWSRRAASEAAKADSLRSAIARIEAERQATEARLAAEARTASDSRARAEVRTRQEAAARPNHGPMTHLAAPVAGTVLHAYGDSVDGGTSTGITYQVPPSARVVAPCAGRVVFSGPFRSFGLLMILDCGGGWHVVLSGFDRLDAQLGQSVVQAEPVGTMPSWNPLALLRRPALQMELRRDGTPTNPAPFMRATG